MSEEADVLFHEASWTGDWEGAAVALHRDLEAALVDTQQWESACQGYREAHEATVQLVLDAGLSTGHADDVVQLMREVLEQYEERRAEVERLKQHNEQLKALTGAANVRVVDDAFLSRIADCIVYEAGLPSALTEVAREAWIVKLCKLVSTDGEREGEG